jgi:hypothetical protein
LLTSRLHLNRAQERKEEGTTHEIIRQNSIKITMTFKMYFLLLLSSEFANELFAGVGDHWNYEDYG